ncbi:MAG: hypothetical protein AABX79_00430 [Nanoarchaeota archaeon]
MLKNLLKEVVSLVAGKQAEEIINILDTKKYINEFVIAKKLNLTINQARNILYKISDHGLVSSTRKKDKRKGWYTYFWKIEVLKSLEFLKENLLNKIGNIEHQIKSRETKRFYACPRCHIELTEENALISSFTCNECGSLLVLKDNAKMLKDLGKNREKLERDLKTVMEEISKEKEVEGKKRAKEIKKEERRVKRAKKKKKIESQSEKKRKEPKIKKPIVKKRKKKKKKNKGRKKPSRKRR